MKRFLKKATCSICMLGLLCSGAMANAEEYLIALDPGHGGDALGCVYSYDGKDVLEKDLNLKIAKYLKDDLENNYETQDGNAISVYLTRENDASNPSLE